MAEYIDREALFKYYRALANIEWNKTVAPISWCDAYEEIADHIAELPTADVVPKSEVERLRGILLQFTDIVHKWGAKNNIDTSEISLVPILQEEADSIIKKANQEYAREIFEEIRKRAYSERGFFVVNSDIDDFIAELKKKYTEERQ